MREIRQSSVFKRDLKREVNDQHKDFLAKHFAKIIETLANDGSLDAKHRDHPLAGEWKDHRDCHIRPDLVLIYRKPDDSTLQLVRLGSHAELSL
ncbi:MAG TPA: type II toxin-antitoxin system YafQ family toxin [Terracidiphilus sp.]|nr:type II toxin-antitoxin system YafQ family toxin [Terracidiphilus sp.]